MHAMIVAVVIANFEDTDITSGRVEIQTDDDHLSNDVISEVLGDALPQYWSDDEIQEVKNVCDLKDCILFARNKQSAMIKFTHNTYTNSFISLTIV